MKKKKENLISIGGQLFRGKTNQHRIFIERGPEVIYDLLTDFNQFKHWVPIEEITVERITPGEFRLGTRFHFKLRFRIGPEWDTEVILLERPYRIVYQFLNGIFEGGIEIWDLKRNESGTEVTHTLLYQMKRWIYKMGWSLLGGEKKHNELTEIALGRLKSLLEERPS
ncbi:MAG: SRPBCC family protein [Thermodesulfobacteriota bacterium]